MKHFLMFLMLSRSICKAHDTNCTEELIECDVENGGNDQSWSLSWLWKKSKQIVWGEERCVCAFTPAQHSLSVRDPFSDDRKNAKSKKNSACDVCAEVSKSVGRYARKCMANGCLVCGGIIVGSLYGIGWLIGKSVDKTMFACMRLSNRSSACRKPCVKN